MAIIAFDLYGTLLSTDSIAAELAKAVGEESGRALAALWRRYQLEYTWRINSMGHYRPFNTITLAALHHAAADLNLIDALFGHNVEQHLMRAYDALDVFPDVPAGLARIVQEKSRPADSNIDDGGKDGNVKEKGVIQGAWIFSNGTYDMLASSVANSPGLRSALQTALNGLVSIDSMPPGARAYKPAPQTYAHFCAHVGAELNHVVNPGDVWLVSSNPFDILGAVAAGMRAVWVDRKATGWVDGLGGCLSEGEGGLGPTVVVRGVEEAVGEVVRLSTV
ncbi:HAD-like domain-containing protein [Dichotomopilus funicola]|uniref:HAD-like domain-containing protein n=1 Tax=Dichotomopilus funicola TaxID=1934379 RepID=A0AAN6V1D0_9PEZI|nr:HAD-like domain-containing protein [Dichotomopilus funicola]